MGIEEQIENQIINNTKDKSFIDKILARREVDEIKRIISKPKMSRVDINQLLYEVAGVEQKLLNYSDYDRYFLTKFFVWIRSFVELLEHYFDYGEFITENKLDTEENTRLYDQLMNKLQHSTRFLIDLYLHLSRSTLSLHASAFTETLRNKYELSYVQQQPQKENNKNWIRG